MTFEHDAFISYRRFDGSLYAHRLRKRLLAYRFPAELRDKLPQRPLSIYIDKIYERTTPDFFEKEIEPALRVSKHLIIVQTPAALEKGTWVEREVAFFRTLPQGDNISVALAHGRIDDPLPAALHEQLPNVERVDVRRLLFGIGVRDAVVKFIATLHDVPPPLMPVLHREEARRRAATAWTITAASVFAIVVLAGLLAWALASRAAARRELATSYFRRAAEIMPQRLARLARALRADPDHRAARALLIATLTRSSWPMPLLDWDDGAPVSEVALSSDESMIMTRTHDTVRIRSARHGGDLSPPLSVRKSFIHDMAMSSDWHRIMIVADNGYEMFDVATGAHRPLSTTIRNVIAARWVSADEIAITDIFDGETGEARLCDAATGNRCTAPIRGIVQYEMCGTLAMVNDHGRYSIVDLRNGRALPLVMPDGGNVGHVRFSGDCSRLAAARTFEGPRFARNDNVAAWDTRAGGEPLATFTHPKMTNELRFSTDGTRLLTTCDDNHARVWDVARRSILRDLDFTPVFSFGSRVNDLRLSADNRVVFVASTAGVQAYDVDSGESIGMPARHARGVTALAVSKDHSKLLSGGDDGVTRLWDIRPGEAQPVTVAIPSALAVRFSADGRRFAVCGAELAGIYDSATGSPVGRRIGVQAADAAIDPTLTRVAVVDDANHVEIRSLTNGAVLARAVKHGGTVHEIAFDETGQSVATAATDGLRTWPSDSSAKVQWLPPAPRDLALTVAFVPGRPLLASGWSDGGLRVHDSTDIHKFAQTGSKESVQRVAVDARGKRLLAVRGAPRVWAIPRQATGALEPIGPELLAHGTYDASLGTISADGTRVASNSDKDVYVWEAGGLRITDAFPQADDIRGLSFVPSTNFLVVITKKRAATYDPEFGAILADFSITSWTPHFDVSADGTQLLVSDDAGVRVYGIGSGAAGDASRLADLAEAVGGERVNEGGAIEAVTARAAIIDRLRRDPTADAVTRWVIADRVTRAPSPLAEGRVNSRTP